MTTNLLNLTHTTATNTIAKADLQFTFGRRCSKQSSLVRLSSGPTSAVNVEGRPKARALVQPVGSEAGAVEGLLSAGARSEKRALFGRCRMRR